MTGHPTFSVVMPVYNRAHLVERAVRSALEQSETDLEVIVVDDGSTDGTAQVVEAIEDPRVILVRQANAGHAAARNQGIQRARGEYVAFLDSDDEYLPGALATIRRAFEDEPHAGFALMGKRMVTDDSRGSTVQELPWEPLGGDLYLGLLSSLRGGIPNGLTVRRQVLETVGGFDENLRAAVDKDLIFRLARQVRCVQRPDVVVACHLHRGPRVTNDRRGKAQAYEVLIPRQMPHLDAHPGVRADLWYKLGWLWYHAGDADRGRRYLKEAVRCRPLGKAALALILFEALRGRGPLLHRRASSARSTVRSALSRAGRRGRVPAYPSR